MIHKQNKHHNSFTDKKNLQSIAFQPAVKA